MSEMLTVVAIIAILTTAAVPAIFAASRNLKMRELDDTAREIFLAAQNALSARKADGTLTSLKGTQVSGQGDFYWLFDDASEFLLPDGAVEPVAAENHIAIWYNAGSAMVLEVYYGEKGGGFASSASEWDESGIQNGDYSNSSQNSGAPDRRLEKRIGYYDGSDLDRGGVEQLLPPALEIVNENELLVKVTVPKAVEYLANFVSLTVTVEELDGSGALTGNAEEFSGTYAVDGTYQLALDSLTAAGQRFQAVCPAIAPGANIRVTARLSAPEQTGTKYLSSGMWGETNSLFERRTGDTVSVAWARHLQNLNRAFSEFSDPAVKARQTDSIDWPGDAAYQPIKNDIASYSGNGLEIRGLNGGMFDYTAAGTTLSGVRIVNPKISGTGAVGALANNANGAVIDDCRVYAAALNGGGTNNFTALEQDFAVASAGGTAGGLIGSAQGCTITNSFSALSRVEGQTAGGLIGTASGCTIENCYATAENLTGTARSAMFIGSMSGGTVTQCYAAGNLASSGGTVSGFANGSGTFNGSYCAVSYNNEAGKPTAVKPYYGFAAGGNTCAYLRVKAPTGTDTAEGRSYEELKTWGVGWQTLSETQTRPYRQELDGKAYPFPGLAMPHYGSWPVQNVTYIKLFDAASEGNELRMIMVPADGEATVWAEADGGAEVTVKEPQDGPIIKAPISEQVGKRTKLTVTAQRGKRGVTCIDLEAGGYQLRAVVVVYQVDVTLEGENLTSHATAKGTATQAGPGTIGRLSLRTNEMTGEFTASLAVKPKKGEIDAALAGMQPGPGEQITLSAAAEDFNGWEELKEGDPAVTANGDPAAGTNILAPVDGNYYPTADSGGTLTVTGAASGTAAVSARWAVDETVAAKCDVKMEGARALIQAVSAVGEDNTVLGSKDGYPYYLDVRAEPHETVTFSFTPKLFGGSGEEQNYTWTLSGGELGAPVTAAKAVAGNGGDVWTYALEGSTGWHNYTVKLEYTNDLGERSADYMTFSVYCAAKRQKEEYGAIRIEKSDPNSQGFLSGSAASVEQINGSSGSGYQHTAELELQSWVNGASNTRVRWSYSADGGATWSPVTGHLGAIPIYETLENGASRIRATVQWMNEKQDYNGAATGGAVRIEGLDVNEYDKAFTFKLRSEAVEATENGDADAAARTVDVSVMNKLRIEPQVKIEKYRKYLGKDPKSCIFKASRTDRLYEYQWTANGETTSSKEASEKEVAGADGAVNVKLRYGPYEDTAVLINQAYVDGLNTYINYSGEKDGKQYFILEKGTTRELVFSWASVTGNWYIKKHPNSTETADLDQIGQTDNDDSKEFAYGITGKEFGTASLEWDMQWVLSHRYPEYDVHVVGMDIKRGGEVLSDSGTPLTLDLGVPTAITAGWSFPADLMDSQAHPDGKPDIQWEISNTELVDFADETHTGETVSLTANKYSATDYTATITATCTVHCVNGREYTYKKHIAVAVPPATGMSVTVEPCAAGDIAGLNGAFGDGLTAGSLLAAVDAAGTPVLIRDSAFGCDTLYLKLRATLNDGRYANLNEYFCNLSIDRSFVDMDTALSSDGTTMYVRLRAKEATADVYRLTLSAAIGDAAREQPIDLYGQPEVTLTRDGTDVTNGSIPVYQDDTALSVTLRAALTPVLYRSDDTERNTPLDIILWNLQAPDGYDPQDYLAMRADEAGTVTVTIRDEKRIPDFRVVLHARSARSDTSDAGYALVFLPVTKEEADTP